MLVGEVGGEGGLDLPTVQPKVRARDLQPPVGLAGDMAPADGVTAGYLDHRPRFPPPHHRPSRSGDGQEETSTMAASAALRLMEAMPFRTPVLVL